MIGKKIPFEFEIGDIKTGVTNYALAHDDGAGGLVMSASLFTDADGKLGVNLIPATQLDVQAATTPGASFGLRVAAGTNASDYCTRFNSATGAVLLNIRGDGNVSIGTDTPFGSETFSVNGEFHIESAAGALKTSAAGLGFGRAAAYKLDILGGDNNGVRYTGASGVAVFMGVNDTEAQLGSASSHICGFYTGSIKRMSIGTSGDVNIFRNSIASVHLALSNQEITETSTAIVLGSFDNPDIQGSRISGTHHYESTIATGVKLQYRDLAGDLLDGIILDGTGTVLIGKQSIDDGEKVGVAGKILALGPIKATPAAANDAIIIQGRAGGTDSFAATLTPAPLTATRTHTLPDKDGTFAMLSDISGSGNPRLVWVDLAFTCTSDPVLTKTITGGDVFTYTYGTTDYYRFVPSPYDATADKFYDTFDSGTDTLSGLLATRGQAI